jgi:hypothetical protein
MGAVAPGPRAAPPGRGRDSGTHQHADGRGELPTTERVFTPVGHTAGWRYVCALVGQCREAVRPVNSRRPTSRSRFATADPLGRVHESHPGAVRAANGTRAAGALTLPSGGRRTHGLDRVGRSAKLVCGDMRHDCRLAGKHMRRAERLRLTLLLQPWHGHPPLGTETS